MMSITRRRIAGLLLLSLFPTGLAVGQEEPAQAPEAKPANGEELCRRNHHISKVWSAGSSKIERSTAINKDPSAIERHHMKDLTVTKVGIQQPSKVAKDLEKIGADWANYWNAKQIDALIGLYAREAVFLTGQGNRITGRPAIREVFKTALKTNTSNLSVHSVVTEESGNLAYNSGEYQQTVTPASGGPQTHLQGNYVIVFKRQPDGKWLIVEHAWTVAPATAQ